MKEKPTFTFAVQVIVMIVIIFKAISYLHLEGMSHKCEIPVFRSCLLYDSLCPSVRYNS